MSRPMTDDVKQQPGGRSIVLSLSEARYGIGYGPRADRSKGIKALAVAERSEGPYGTIEADDVYRGAYPLTRDLYLYRLDPPADAGSQGLVDAFLRHLLSPQGQAMVEAAGFLKLPDERISAELAELGTTTRPPE